MKKFKVGDLLVCRMAGRYKNDYVYELLHIIDPLETPSAVYISNLKVLNDDTYTTCSLKHGPWRKATQKDILRMLEKNLYQEIKNNLYEKAQKRINKFMETV